MNRLSLSLQLPFYFCCLVFFLVLTNCAAATHPKGEAIDGEFAVAMSAGRAAFDQGLIEESATIYQRALRRARAMDSAAAIGDAAYNLAASRIRLGQLERARELLNEAKTEISSIHGDIADIQLVEAKVARLQGHPEEALMLADQVLTSPGSYPLESLRLQVYLLSGHIGCDKGDAAMALRELQKAQNISSLVSDPAQQADISALAGRIHLIKNEPVLAAREFDSETRLLRQAKRYAEMARALHNAAEAYLSAGNYSLAADRFFRAARSLFAQGQNSVALKLGHLALSAANSADDPSAITRIRGLLDEIETATTQ